MNAHTPGRPWTVRDTLDSEDDDVLPVIEILDAAGDFIATVQYPEHAPLLAAAPDLLAALQAFMDATTASDIRAAQIGARAAIAKAGESMTDYRHRISSSIEFDDDRHWRFSRNSGLPRHYFDRPRLSPDAVVVIVCSVIGGAMLVALIAERITQ